MQKNGIGYTKVRLLNYELHVKGFTETCQYLPEDIRGTYLGVCHPFSIAHLLELGVNCVEFMPILDSKSTYWGYDPITYTRFNSSYSASEEVYGTTEEQVMQMVDTLQENGIMVVFDVVYNHVHNDYIKEFEIVHGVDFRKDDITGCGNTVDVQNSLDYIFESIDYLLRDVNADGLRFDLARVLGVSADSNDFNPNAPFFKRLEDYKDKLLIAEPWDCCGYSLGAFPPYMVEICDKIRDAVRTGGTFYCGDNYHKYMGFVTCHDGYTLEDLVSYNNNEKDNFRNGENNRDGCNNNHSNNHGVRGATDNEWILTARKATKNQMYENLFTSSYHVMILSGDEFSKTQLGCNNDYLYGTPLTWPSGMGETYS